MSCFHFLSSCTHALQSDPRSFIVRKTADEVFRVFVWRRLLSSVAEAHGDCSTGRDPLLDTAMALHDAAMKDEFFVKRNLAPNVDFWRSARATSVLVSSAHCSLQRSDLPGHG
jgi:citrate synthase